MLKRHIQLHNCTTKLLHIFLVGKFSFEFEKDTISFQKNLSLKSGYFRPEVEKNNSGTAFI
jgi:hypothetical protein